MKWYTSRKKKILRSKNPGPLEWQCFNNLNIMLLIIPVIFWGAEQNDSVLELLLMGRLGGTLKLTWRQGMDQVLGWRGPRYSACHMTSVCLSLFLMWVKMVSRCLVGSNMWNLSIAKAKLVPLSAEGSQACAPIMKGEEAGRQKCKQQRRTGTLKGEGSEGRMERI